MSTRRGCPPNGRGCSRYQFPAVARLGPEHIPNQLAGLLDLGRAALRSNRPVSRRDAVVTTPAAFIALVAHASDVAEKVSPAARVGTGSKNFAFTARIVEGWLNF